MNKQIEAALNNLVRIGTINSVDVVNQTARVAYHDKQDSEGNPLMSGPLKVLQNPPFVFENKTQPISGGSGEEAFEEHAHTLIINPWLPHVGQLVLCLYLPKGESDGVVIGGI